MLVTLTLLPVLLATAGRRVDWPRRRKPAHASRGWSAWARGVVRVRWLAALAALAILVPLGIAAFGLVLGTPRAEALATSGPARTGLVALEDAGLPTGILTPLEVLVPAGTDPAQVAGRLAGVPGVRAALAPDEPAWRRDGTALVSVQPIVEASTPAGRQTIARVRQAAASFPGVQVGGNGPFNVDFASAVYGRFPLMVAIIAAVTFVLLARAFRSLLLPAKAVLLNLLSVGAIYGVLVLVWQDGHGSNLWGIPATGSTTTAIVEGLGRTGRLVTSAALILFLAFASLASGPDVSLKVFATGLGAGILLDATVVRALLVPALVSLFGRWNWWLPAWAARPLGVAPSPARPEPEADHPAIPRANLSPPWEASSSGPQPASAINDLAAGEGSRWMTPTTAAKVISTPVSDQARSSTYTARGRAYTAAMTQPPGPVQRTPRAAATEPSGDEREPAAPVDVPVVATATTPTNLAPVEDPEQSLRRSEVPSHPVLAPVVYRRARWPQSQQGRRPLMQGAFGGGPFAVAAPCFSRASRSRSLPVALTVAVRSRRTAHEISDAPGSPVGRSGASGLVARPQAGAPVLCELVGAISSSVGPTRRRCQNPSTVSSSITPASANEAMLATSAICPTFQNA